MAKIKSKITKEKNIDKEEKVISIKINDLNQLKIILSTWYTYLLTKMNQKENSSKIELFHLMKTPIFYNMEKDELELMISGSESLLRELNDYILDINQKLNKKKNEA